jgi:hypothetical protein
MTQPIHPAHPVTPKAADYIIVTSNEEDPHAGYHHFADKVNRKLRTGYQLLGQPFSTGKALCQAMIRSSDAPPAGEPATPLKRASDGDA